MELAFLQFRPPEPMPFKVPWRGLKQVVAANRGYASADELAERATARLDGMPDAGRRRRFSPASSKFDWLPTWVPRDRR